MIDPTFEITIRCLDGDLVSWREIYRDFHEACEAALNWTTNTHPSNIKIYDGRVVSVIRIEKE